MSKFRGSLADYVYAASGNERTCKGCAVWDSEEPLFDCPKGGLVHRAEVRNCHSKVEKPEGDAS